MFNVGLLFWFPSSHMLIIVLQLSAFTSALNEYFVFSFGNFYLQTNNCGSASKISRKLFWFIKFFAIQFVVFNSLFHFVYNPCFSLWKIVDLCLLAQNKQHSWNFHCLQIFDLVSRKYSSQGRHVLPAPIVTFTATIQGHRSCQPPSQCWKRKWMPAKLGHEDTLHAGRTTQYTMYCTVYAETCSTTPYTRSVQKGAHFHTRTVLQIALRQVSFKTT